MADDLGQGGVRHRKVGHETAHDLFLIAFERRGENLLLVAESPVKPGMADPRTGDQVAYRGIVIALFPEQAHGLFQGDLGIEFAVTGPRGLI